MWKFLSLLLLLQYVDCDLYMQTPRGSNNRLDGTDRERDTDNRLFDSQNNNRAGYNVGGPKDRKVKYYEIYNKYKTSTESGIRARKEEEEAPPGKMKYYGDSVLYVSWTAQHECGKSNSKCEIVLQYMCDDNLRDGIKDERIPEMMSNCDIGEDQKSRSCDQDRRYGMHENWEYYALCKNTKRNDRLFEADQNLVNRQTAQYTRQNDNGNRNGYECPEERDYYPYWRPSPWIDIAVLTYDLERCKLYQSESENVRPREYCQIPQELTDKLVKENRDDYRIPITKSECEKFEYKGTKGKWVKDTRPKYPAPECLLAPQNRDNHHGNGPDGFLSSFNWTIPNLPHKHCVLRGRYNITTSETEWDTDQLILTKQLEAIKDKTLRCTGEGDGCCTVQTPCGEGEGDCDDHDECAEGLVCGKNNSPWDDDTDICVADVTGIRVPQSGPYINKPGVNCWRDCGRKGGLCEKVCGEGGYCCRKGYGGCDDRLANVATRYHSCVKDFPKLECTFSNEEASGGTQKKVADEKLTEYECFEECLDMKKKDDSINGCAMYQNGNPGCFVQHGAQSLRDGNTYKTCLLKPAQEKKLTCTFVPGDGEGRKERKISSELKGEECVKECIFRKKWDTEINGVSVYQEDRGGCWCEYGMVSVKWSARYKTCLLVPEGVDAPPQPPRCRGENSGCCTDDNPCDIGEGDCDDDSECKGELVCGYNNCPKGYGSGDDCCMENILAKKIGGDPVELKNRGFKFQEDPTVRPLKLVHDGEDVGKLLELDIALNTAQTGRTFEDRSHDFSIVQKPSKYNGKKIYNMEVDGKRGNIVQVYPNKEYDYAPSRLEVEQGDLLHIQWTGSERNPRNNDGNGRPGYDRSNMVLMKEESWVEGTLGKAVPLDEKNGHWGVNYPNTFNAEGKSTDGKSLMGLGRSDLHKLALSNDVPLADEADLLSQRILLKGVSSQIRNDVKVEMQCPDQQVIRVVSATYAGCPSDAKTCSEELDKCTGFRTQEKLKKDCDDLQDCLIEASKGTYELNCDAVGYLSVTYKCIKKEQPDYTCDKWVSGKYVASKTLKLGPLKEDECIKRCWESKFVEDYRRINAVSVRSNNLKRECRCVLEMTGVNSKDTRYKTCTLKKRVSPPKKWRDDGKCGAKYPLSSGGPSECNPTSSAPCCSKSGVCGGDNDDCHCSSCINYLKGFKGDVDEVEMDKRFKEPKKKPNIVTSVVQSPLNVDLYRCRGQDNGCCTEETPCDLYEGDCDNDRECKGNLICIDNNCPWDDNDDCCAKPSYLDLDASSHYMDLGPRSMDLVGEFKYMCTRNNDFSNRSHKGKLKVVAKSSRKKDENVEEKKTSAAVSSPRVADFETRIEDLLKELKYLEKNIQ